jgi:ADP-ribosylglycohydrolase
MNEIRLDKIKGVFYGQAIGDALGLGTEFLSRQQIAEFYPEGLTEYHQIMQDAHRKRWIAGHWTDDTDQFLCICDSIIQASGVDEMAFAYKLFEWFSGSPMGIGKTVYKVVSMPQFTLYPHKAAELVWKISGKKLASNGAVMRTSILGTYEFWDYSKVLQNTEKIARVTHWDSRCVGSCAIITSIIAALLNEYKYLSASELQKIAESYDQRISPYIELALSRDISALELDDPHSIGYTLKAMAAGLWAYFHAESFEDGLLKVIHEGGDADTNASVAGSLLGAKFGYSAIPEKYILGLRNRDLLQSKLNAFLDKLDHNPFQKDIS